MTQRMSLGGQHVGRSRSAEMGPYFAELSDRALINGDPARGAKLIALAYAAFDGRLGENIIPLVPRSTAVPAIMSARTLETSDEVQDPFVA